MKLESLAEIKKDLSDNGKSKKSTNGNTKDFSDGYKKGIEESFNSFSQLINQFKKYQNNVKLLMNEEKKIWKQWVTYYEKQSDISKTDYLDKYNAWLFEYLFCNIAADSYSFDSLY